MRSSRSEESDLAASMAALAEAFASGNGGLDYSVASLDIVDESLDCSVLEDDDRFDQVAAYVGEVVRRGTDDVRWASRPRRVDGPRDQPGLEFRKWFADPYDYVRLRYLGQSEHSLREVVGALAAYVAEPTGATIERLGWSYWVRFPERRRRWLRGGRGQRH